MFTKPQQYRFSGDPVSQAAAVEAHKAQMAAEGQIGAASQMANGNIGSARWQAMGNLYGAPGEVYKSQAGNSASLFRDYAQGLGGAANAQAGLYGNYNTSLANLYGSQMAAMGQTEAARQLGLSNLGTASLSAGGQASSAAMGAWGQNQAAFARAMADAQSANQQALAQYGVGRDSALAGTSAAAAAYGGSLANATAQYGQSRESALAALGNSAATYGGTLANAQSQYGQTAAAARGNMLTGQAATDLGGYNAGLNYGRDMAKLGLARELGTGQLSVASQTAAALPAAFSGIGNAMGGLQLTAGGSPSANVDSSGQYAGGSWGGGSGGGGGGGGASSQPLSFGQGREWYQNQQVAPAWQSQTPAAVASMDAMDDRVLGALASGGPNVFGAIDRSRQDVVSSPVLAALAARGADAYDAIDRSQQAISSSPVLKNLMSSATEGRAQLDRAYNSSQTMPSQLLAQSLAGFRGMLSESSKSMNSGMDQFYANIPRDGADRMREGLTRGAADLRNTIGMLSSGFTSANSAARGDMADYQNFMREIMDRTGVVSPVEQQRQQFQMQDERNARAIALRDKLRQERMARTMSRTRR